MVDGVEFGEKEEEKNKANYGYDIFLLCNLFSISGINITECFPYIKEMGIGYEVFLGVEIKDEDFSILAEVVNLREKKEEKNRLAFPVWTVILIVALVVVVVVVAIIVIIIIYICRKRKGEEEKKEEEIE